MADIADIKAYWDEQAKLYGDNPRASTQDIFMRDIEIDYVIRFLSGFTQPMNVLDIGCSNGYSTLKYKERVSWHRYSGGDYSAEMIRHAQSEVARLNLQEGIQFEVMDVTRLAEYAKSFDIVVSDRCLINLGDSENRKRAIHQIADCLPVGGHYLMIENFMEGQDELNKLREQLGIQPIPVRWHNSFFTMDELQKSAKGLFSIKKVENISSLYYLITRVVYSKLCQLEGREPDYDHPIYDIATKLPPIGNFGPIQACVLVRE